MREGERRREEKEGEGQQGREGRKGERESGRKGKVTHSDTMDYTVTNATTA